MIGSLFRKFIKMVHSYLVTLRATKPPVLVRIIIFVVFISVLLSVSMYISYLQADKNQERYDAPVVTTPVVTIKHIRTTVPTPTHMDQTEINIINEDKDMYRVLNSDYFLIDGSLFHSFNGPLERLEEKVQDKYILIDEYTIKNSRDVFYRGKKIEGVDANSFERLNDYYLRDNYNVYYFDRDGVDRVSPIDIESFVIIVNNIWKDKNGLHTGDTLVSSIDKDSATVFSMNYIKDRNNLYYLNYEGYLDYGYNYSYPDIVHINGLDIESLEYYGFDIFSDKNGLYKIKFDDSEDRMPIEERIKLVKLETYPTNMQQVPPQQETPQVDSFQN
jgi:hypothetical protein